MEGNEHYISSSANTDGPPVSSPSAGWVCGVDHTARKAGQPAGDLKAVVQRGEGQGLLEF